MVLHKQGKPHEEYDASRWLYGKNKGTVVLTAPHEPGRYTLTAVRDVKYVHAVMSSVMPHKASAARVEEFSQRVDQSKKEDLCGIGHIDFVVVSGEDKKSATSQREVGSTGPDPANWVDDLGPTQRVHG